MTTAIVTGSSGALGSAIASHLARRGWRVFGLDIVPATPQEEWTHVQCDLSEKSAIEGAANLISGDVGAIVHAAAIQSQISAFEPNYDAWQHVWKVNVLGIQHLVACTFDSLSVHPPHRVVTIGSVHGSHSSPSIAPYAVSKAALAGFARSLSIDGASRGVSAVNLELGATDSALLRTGLERWPEPDAALAILKDRLLAKELVTVTDVAQTVEWLLSPSSRHVCGSTLTLDGGATILLSTEVGEP